MDVSDTNAKNWFTDRGKNQTMPRSLAAVTGKTVVAAPSDADAKTALLQTETGGPKGPEPTRYGDWERKGRCIDF